MTLTFMIFKFFNELTIGCIWLKYYLLKLKGVPLMLGQQNISILSKNNCQFNQSYFAFN